MKESFRDRKNAFSYTIKEQLAKVAFLKAWHVDASALGDLRLERQRD